MKRNDNQPVEWRVSREPKPYIPTVQEMEERALKISLSKAPELVWFLEHPPIYTAGTSAKMEDLLDPRFPVYHVSRGGKLTYHGPGQRLIYLMLDLKKRNPDVRAYVRTLEEWVICSLKEVDIKAEPRPDRVGLWVQDGGQEKKIAAIGVRVQKWVTLHGVSLNIAPNLEHFQGIIPCGLQEYGVTSLEALGISISLEEMDAILQKNFSLFF